MQTLGSAPSAGVDINGYTYVYWQGAAVRIISILPGPAPSAGPGTARGQGQPQ